MRRIVLPLAILTVALAPALLLGDDNQIAEKVVERLAREKDAGALRNFELDLKVEQGQVWVMGRVANTEQQELVLDVARRVPGVVQVVNDLRVEGQSSALPAPAQPTFAAPTAADAAWEPELGPANNGQTSQQRGLLATMMARYGGVDQVRPVANQQAVSTRRAAPQGVGTGVMPQQAMQMPMQMHAQPQARSRHAGMPLAFAPAMGGARPASMQQPIGNPGGPQPTYIPNQGGITPATYDHPQMPNYAWPSYAASPNYAALTYPKQYSPTAWPYIGPFYPYPQVPLGWRKVTLEWDDGWWFLDFNDGSKRRRFRQ